MSTVKVILLFGICVFCQNLLGQLHSIRGKVTTEDGYALPDTHVVVMGTDRGTVTDDMGAYIIEGNSSDILEFTYVGHTQVQVPVQNNRIINVRMTPAITLDEAVVIGYGTSSREEVTGSIVTVSSGLIEQSPENSIQGTLVGKTAGVQISRTGGRVDSGFRIRVRGVTTINGSQEPLYVVDGIPIIKQDDGLNLSPINALVSFNPDDIASVEILKDASAAAIYGARATNGVVLITTKKGQKGKTRISLNSSIGISETTNRREWLNTSEYVELYTEAILNAGGTLDDVAFFFNQNSVNEDDWREEKVDTDWQDIAFVTGETQDIGLSVSGGGEQGNFYISTAYHRTNGILRGNTLERYSTRINMEQNALDWLTIGTNTSLSKTQIARIDSDPGFGNPIGAVAQVPFSRPYQDDGVTPNPRTLYYNFLLNDFNGEHNANIWRALLKVYGEVHFTGNLNFRSEAGYDFNNQLEETFFGSLTENASTNGRGAAYNIQNEKFVLNNYFTHLIEKENWNLEAVLGMSYEEDRLKYQYVVGQDFPSDRLRKLVSAGEITEGETFETAFSFLSYFARFNTTFSGRYLLKGSLRVDGSSRFGENTRYGTFPAISAGWLLSEEGFLKESTLLSNLKLRAGWGLTGNAEVGNFASRTQLGTWSYNLDPAFIISNLGDPDLGWEKTEQYNLGLDLGFFDNRILASLDYYSKKTKHILLGVPIPSTNGQRLINRNAGSVENNGLELTLDTKNIISRDLRWTTTFNMAYNRNKVTGLPGGNDIVAPANIARIGEAIGSFYLVEYAGVDPADGDALFYLNAPLPDGTLDRSVTDEYSDAERVVLGSPLPDVIAGMNNSLIWKWMDFSFVLQGQWGAELYHRDGPFQSSNADFFDNQTRDQLLRWQQPGDITRVPQARLFGGNGSQDSSRYLEGADFVRLRELTVGFTLPFELTEQWGINRLRIYMTGSNLLTFTEYSGWDPESSYEWRQSNLEAGLAFFSPPQARTLTIGFNIDF